MDINNKIEDTYPLTAMQKAMLLGSLMAPDSGVYIAQLVCNFYEALDIDAFKKAWDSVVSRHHILRTGYRWEDVEEPQQIVYSHVDIPFEVIDWRNISAAELKAAFAGFMKTDRKKRIDLTKAPVMRLTLFRLSEAHYRLVWTYHHIIVDGSSHPVLLEDLFKYYDAICEKREISLPPPIPYRDYVVWLNQQDAGKSEKYWRKTLSGYKSSGLFTSLTTFEYFSNNRREFDEIELRVPENIIVSLQNLARENNVSLNNITQGVWSLLLSAYGGVEDVVFGTVRAGRHWSKGPTDEMIGLFIYTLPMRALASPGKMIMPWLQEIKQSQYTMRDHETTPANNIQQWSEIPPSKPLFESILTFLNFDLTSFMQSKGGKWLNREFYISIDNGYPITLYGNVKSELILQIAYDRAIFSDPEEIRQILQNLKSMLESIADNPGQSLAQIKAAIKAERKVTHQPGMTDRSPAAPAKTYMSPDNALHKFIADSQSSGTGVVDFKQKTDARTMARRSNIMRRQQMKQSRESVSATQRTASMPKSQVRYMTTMVISASFTTEPVKETLSFWEQKLQYPVNIEFAPYNQVFQQLLDPSSLLLKNSGGMNVILIRFEDWTRDDKTLGIDKKLDKINENANHLIEALRSATNQSGAHFLICICPASPAMAENGQAASFQKIEDNIYSSLSGISNIHVIKSSELFARYGIASYYDSYTDELGHVPYTPEFFAALATMITRKLYAIYSPPKKVIVLDCDQTLWKGICGEDGPMGIEIDEPRKKLQEFMVGQYKAGILLCLCSKNNEEDVNEVFKHHPEMPLKREYITAKMINWRSKSENLKALAKNLELGLDSFIFVDDNPVECNEVQTIFPEVLTLCLPEEPGKIPGFLENVWAFDHLKVTEEDKKRTELYQQNAQRKDLEQRSLTLADFLVGLELKVQISQATPEHFARVAQLTQRTNQFNLTTIRRTEAEISNACQSQNMECLITEAIDRFGDYGLVGVMLFNQVADSIKVDTFLLSCRAMGKGIEHNMLARLGKIAGQRGLGYVEVPFISTKKNQPAQDFLEKTCSDYKQPLDNGFVCKLPVEYAGKIVYVPGNGKPADTVKPEAGATTSSPIFVKNKPDSLNKKSEMLIYIAGNLTSAGQIVKEVETWALGKNRNVTTQYSMPQNELERSVQQIWKKVLCVDNVGINDNFFEVGGTSLKGVQLMAQINREFKINLSIVTLFERPTIYLLVGAIAG